MNVPVPRSIATPLSTADPRGSGQRIDGRGMTLMPGLIDAHLHLIWNNAPGINPIQMMPSKSTC